MVKNLSQIIFFDNNLWVKIISLHLVKCREIYWSENDLLSNS